MAPRVANHVKHLIGRYVEQARDGAPDIGCLLLLSAGLPGDTTLQDYTTVAQILATTADEPTFTNYARKLLPSPEIIVDNAADRVIMTISGASPKQISWANAGAGTPVQAQAIGKIIFYYDPAPGSATPDSGLVFLSSSDIGAVTDGTTLVITLRDNEGFAYAYNPA